MLRLAPWKVASILALVFCAAFLVAPSFLAPQTVAAVQARLPSFILFRPITLGLDLQGGAHILMEVDSPSVIKTQVESLRDDVRAKMREGKISISGGIAVQPRGVVVRIADPAERGRALTALQSLNQPVGGALTGATGHSLDIADTGDGAIQLQLTDVAINDRIRRAVQQSIEVLNRRLNGAGTKETNVQQEGVDRILIEVPGLQDTTKVKELLGATAKLEFRLVADPGDPPSEFEQLPQVQGGGTVPVQKQVMVSGEDLVDAQPSFDSRTGEPDVNFRFNLRGGQRFGQVTSENVGKLFAIVLDGKVISAPRILGPITGGSGQITGNFTVEQADNLAVLLRAGALPAKLTVVEERTVGPGLGQDSIEAGKRAAYVGGALVIVYMLTTYGVFGVFADVALAVHILFIFASMALLGATLTLPGIAGIVFTIGMAVDSNVLIYERIREESHLGRTVISSLDAGFKRAFATIIDSNVTMFVAAMILYLFGSGPVRGFAVSLGLGI
ncbi:MAG: protein translocase subunit SecD, partial [Hyphomicrobiales bacterium]|nr:protein translocase subunit SecD [Hyphomicrobiales bacterium]